ncbi:serine/threonine-protein kinase [Tenggerimyces flavus]|uniref:non-specific serine/threonine protein kinase n=1 Tax=Tenggerimyces flavus TaxID=1708749 RepID=A0ABV7YLX8_9ACTN|nr:serine/threonine-protein kinase [Tenggerimyces flavus]MBM7790167.1 hypothetical protein [Tenggerimyces flavus]
MRSTRLATVHSAGVLPTTGAISEAALALRGYGPAAQVYDLTGPDGEGTAVVKVYSQAPDPTTEAAFQGEQSAVAELPTAPSIVRANAVARWPDGRWGLVMDRCDRSLAELVAAGPLPIHEILGIAEAVALVLADAHRAGLAHGGLTPSNVLIGAGGRVMLSDFGLVLRRHFPRNLRVDAAYAAPERLSGGSLGPPSDLYGLGCLLHACLTGRPPFPPLRGEPLDQHVRRVIGVPAPPLVRTDAPPGLGPLVAQLLEKDPARRPGDATAVAELLTRWRNAPPSRPVRHEFDDFLGAVLDRPQAVLTVPPPVRKGAARLRYAPVAIAFAGAIVAGAAAAFVPVAIGPPPSEATSPLPVLPTSTTVAPKVKPAVPSPTVRPTTGVGGVTVVDRRTTVRLSWNRLGKYDYAVVVAEQGRKSPDVHFVQRNTSIDLPVDPALSYCFQVQATDGRHVLVSQPHPIRGATCHG